jgi:arsenite methyltransferase
MTEPARDKWAEWLLERRHGGDPEDLEAALDYLYPVRNRILDNAGIGEGDVVLDVGAGDGLIAFGALERVGTFGAVIFSDVSQDLLDHARSLAEETRVIDRCRFMRAPAEDLGALEDASVDVVTTRSVLIYVEDKRRAFEEFHRVLKPGGRLSIFEPINAFAYPEPPHLFGGYDVGAVQDIAGKVRDVTERIMQPVAGSMLGFDERDLLAFAQQAGFGEIHLEYRAEIVPANATGDDTSTDTPTNWETALRSSPNPLAPTLKEGMQQALTPSEAERFEAHLRPLVERGQRIRREAVAYLWAVKGERG